MAHPGQEFLDHALGSAEADRLAAVAEVEARKARTGAERPSRNGTSPATGRRTSPVLDIACPKCGASVGDRCLTQKGTPRKSHIVRREAAQVATEGA